MSIKNEMMLKDQLFNRFLYHYHRNEFVQLNYCIKVSEDMGFKNLTSRFKELVENRQTETQTQDLNRSTYLNA